MVHTQIGLTYNLEKFSSRESCLLRGERTMQNMGDNVKRQKWILSSVNRSVDEVGDGRSLK